MFDGPSDSKCPLHIGPAPPGIQGRLCLSCPDPFQDPFVNHPIDHLCQGASQNGALIIPPLTPPTPVKRDRHNEGLRFPPLPILNIPPELMAQDAPGKGLALIFQLMNQLSYLIIKIIQNKELIIIPGPAPTGHTRVCCRANR